MNKNYHYHYQLGETLYMLDLQVFLSMPLKFKNSGVLLKKWLLCPENISLLFTDDSDVVIPRNIRI